MRRRDLALNLTSFVWAVGALEALERHGIDWPQWLSAEDAPWWWPTFSPSPRRPYDWEIDKI